MPVAGFTKDGEPDVIRPLAGNFVGLSKRFVAALPICVGGTIVPFVPSIWRESKFAVLCEGTPMEFTISFNTQAGDAACVLCSHEFDAGSGLRLSLPDGTVCRSCGRRHAPHLVALVDLAASAERAGKVCRHLLVPPMECLLDLARAAEDYTSAAPQSLTRAA